MFPLSGSVSVKEVSFTSNKACQSCLPKAADSALPCSIAGSCDYHKQDRQPKIMK